MPRRVVAIVLPKQGRQWLMTCKVRGLPTSNPSTVLTCRRLHAGVTGDTTVTLYGFFCVDAWAICRHRHGEQR